MRRDLDVDGLGFGRGESERCGQDLIGQSSDKKTMGTDRIQQERRIEPGDPSTGPLGYLNRNDRLITGDQRDLRVHQPPAAPKGEHRDYVVAPDFDAVVDRLRGGIGTEVRASKDLFDDLGMLLWTEVFSVS
ncbi:hypothetical protein Q2298_21910 [Rhodococcus electrodiphilus]|nr:hypothetical protein [Rhodococcus ruber]MDO2381011.1 hypothetical protein [Rhodococcus ruber]